MASGRQGRDDISDEMSYTDSKPQAPAISKRVSFRDDLNPRAPVIIERGYLCDITKPLVGTIRKPVSFRDIPSPRAPAIIKRASSRCYSKPPVGSIGKQASFRNDSKPGAAAHARGQISARKHIGVLNASIGIGVRRVTAIVDTGASHCVMAIICVERFGLSKYMKPCSRKYYSANGTMSEPLGILHDIPFTFGSGVASMSFFVSPATGFNVLLGNDFTVPAKLTIDLERLCIRRRIGGGSVEIIPLDVHNIGREKLPMTVASTAYST